MDLLMFSLLNISVSQNGGVTCLAVTEMFRVGCKMLEKAVLPDSTLALGLWRETRLDILAMNDNTCKKPASCCQKFVFPRTETNLYTYCLQLPSVPAPLPWRTNAIANISLKGRRQIIEVTTSLRNTFLNNKTFQKGWEEHISEKNSHGWTKSSQVKVQNIHISFVLQPSKLWVLKKKKKSQMFLHLKTVFTKGW